MNDLKGHITDFTNKGHLTLVKVGIGTTEMSAIIIDTPETAGYLRTGNPIHVLFKETEVFIGLGTDIPISLQNRLIGTIESIETGDLLSKIVVNTDAGAITSVITTNAVEALSLQKGIEVTAMIKTNEIMLAE